MEGLYWVVLVCPGSTFQHEVHQKQRQISRNANASSSGYHGDYDDALDSSKPGACGDTRTPSIFLE